MTKPNVGDLIPLVTEEDLDAHTVDRDNPHNVTAEQIGAETPEGAQAKVDALKAEYTQYKKSAPENIRNAESVPLRTEVVSSSVSETPDVGRIIFDTSQGKFFGGNGTEWV